MPAFEIRNASLFQDGKALVCPFVPRFIIPYNMDPEKGQLIGTECGTWCPLFELWLSDDDLPPQAHLHCGSGKRVIAPIKILEQKTKLSIFKKN